MINKYNEYILEKQFKEILDEIFKIVENTGVLTGDNTYEWDLTEPKETQREFEWDLTKQNPEDSGVLGKLKKFLSNLSKEDIKKYFIKLINSIKSLPELIRRKLIINYTSVFLLFTTLGYLISNNDSIDKNNNKKNNIILDIKNEIDNKIKKEIILVLRKSDFNESQKIVKSAEAGYSDDRGDTGNYFKGRFIGTNHGISAPILADYLGRIPSRKDMEDLSYETALEIYKRDYWDAQNLSEFCDQSVANIIYDGCVNQGTTALRKIVRNAFKENGIKISDNDNPFDKKWIKKANVINQVKLFNSLKEGREDRYKESRTFKRHGKGWLARLDRIEYKDSNIA
jgi:lysozyme family protein